MSFLYGSRFFLQVLKLELAVYLFRFIMTEQEVKITFQVEQISHFCGSVVHSKEARWQDPLYYLHAIVVVTSAIAPQYNNGTSCVP